MRLVYFAGTKNFGDELNRLLWPHFMPNLFDPADRTGFLGIGTIIGMPTPDCDYLHVFSSGVGYDRLSEWHMPHQVWCLRGPLSAQVLNAEPDAVVTDGAVLTPWVLPNELAQARFQRIGVIPHWESLHYPGWSEACALAGFTLINPMNDPRKVVRAICATQLVLTESLHGAIIADSYNIPWIPFRTSRNFSVFKWMDWCLSVEAPLRAIAVPPPSVDALLRFGRPQQAWGSCTTFTEADAMTEFKERVGVPGGRRRAEGLHRRALRALRSSAVQSPPIKKVLGLSAGYRSARTAAHLTRAAQLSPNLSHAARRDLLQNRMIERLSQLSHAASSGAPL